MKITEETKEKIYKLCDKDNLCVTTIVKKVTNKSINLIHCSNLEGKNIISYFKKRS